MKLSFEQLCAAASGAVSAAREEDGVRFYRMYPEQAAAVAEQNRDFERRAQTAAGIKLTFRTDSSSLFLQVRVGHARVRGYFAVDVYVNDKPVGSIDNYSHVEDIEHTVYSAMSFPFGSHEGSFDLGVGEKTVCIHLPWSMSCSISELSLQDGASFVPAVPEKKILFYGDSITQGYDALHPSMTYASRLARALGMAEYNKGVGGAAYCPKLAAVKEEFVPDAVVVAYGSNDWGAAPTSDFFREQCRQMYGAIRANYPQTPVFAMGPILRHTSNECRGFGAFCKMAKIIEQVAGEFSNITAIDCLTFVPCDPGYYGDGIVHPNDRGFAYYFKALYPRIKAVLEKE